MMCRESACTAAVFVCTHTTFKRAAGQTDRQKTPFASPPVSVCGAYVREPPYVGRFMHTAPVVVMYVSLPFCRCRPRGHDRPSVSQCDAVIGQLSRYHRSQMDDTQQTLIDSSENPP